MMVFRRAIDLVRKNVRAFLLMNVAYFGCVCSGMAFGAWDREVSDAYKVDVRKQAAQTLPAVVDVYQNGHVAKAIGLTFAVNLLAGSFLVITLPSLIVPFSGLLVGGVRAFVWGIVFSPSLSAFNGAVLAYGILIAFLLFLEGEGYVLAMLGSYIQGRSFAFPQSAGAMTRWQGYQVGTSSMLRLYAPIAAVLALAAAYEAVLVIYILPLVR